LAGEPLADRLELLLQVPGEVAVAEQDGDATLDRRGAPNDLGQVGGDLLVFRRPHSDVALEDVRVERRDNTALL
jgi:hypothetical protein